MREERIEKRAGKGGGKVQGRWQAYCSIQNQNPTTGRLGNIRARSKYYATYQTHRHQVIIESAPTIVRQQPCNSLCTADVYLVRSVHGRITEQ
eukprot:8125504-Pyramimonas_sp.AAC.1